MTPTPKLRFVERSQPDYPGAPTGRTIRVLQQWWEDRVYKGNNWFVEGGEWRDVPLEKEE
jgi:hypothetical protein